MGPGACARRALVATLAALLAAAVPIRAVSLGQDKVTHESEHFLVTAERRKTYAAVSAEAAAWLEDALKKQSAFYDFAPDEKIQVVLRDEDDYSNGYAFATNSWIVLHLPPARFTLRGPGQWIPNVAAHELAHILTLRKMGVKERFLGVEAFASFGARRSRIDADAAWLPDDVPAWLAEGLAQYGAMHCGHDTLDTRRAMLLRQAWKSGTLPPLKAVETFSGDARDGEMAYNVGFHLTDFMYRAYGREAVNAMMDAWNDQGYHGAFRTAFGATPAEVDARWRAELDVRFAAEGAAPGSNGAAGGVRPNETVYRLETSPVRDEARGITYYLSSRANDFGITHLYAAADRDGGLPRLIRREVNAPLNLAPDGALLFTANRPDRRTGASRADLYRYDPRDASVTRVTENRRVIAGAQAGKHVYVLVQNAGRVRLARLTKKGRPEAWVDPRAGSEFSSLAPGDDSTLFVTAARGGHADILRFDARTGTLATAEASPAREIDPHVDAGRLYFASDRTGEQAVYSRAGDTLYRHTPPGVPAFSPFVRDGTLHFVAYEEGGFRRRTMPLATYSAEISPADSSGGAHAPPPPTRVRNLRRDATWLEPVGYYATLGYGYTPSADVTGSLYGDRARNFRLNPCGHRAFAGGGVLAVDADQRHVLGGTVLAGRCLEDLDGTRTHLPFAGIEYVNGNRAADLMILAQYQNELISNLDGDPRRLGGLHSFQVMGAGVYRLGLNVQNVLFAQVAGAVAHLPDPQGTVEGGGGLLVGNTLGFAILEPGADFVNQGVYANLTGAASPGTALYALDGGVHAHVERTLFLGLHGDILQTTVDPADLDAGLAATADMRMPLGITAGTTGRRGLYMESLFLTAGYALRANASTGIALAHAPGIRAVHARARGRSTAYVSQVREVGPLTLQTGFRLKVITPGSRVAFWHVLWESPPGSPEDGYLSVSISL